jgi:hypothetical protein
VTASIIKLAFASWVTRQQLVLFQFILLNKEPRKVQLKLLFLAVLKDSLRFAKADKLTLAPWIER